MTIKEIVAEIGHVKTLMAVLFIGGLSLNGVVQFLKDAPAIVNANAAHLVMHHDTIVDLAQAVEAFQAHTIAEDSINIEQATAIMQLVQGQDYLICLRQERKSELDGVPFPRDCGLELVGR